MKKVLPFIYIVIGLFILIVTFSQFFKDQESYRVLLSFRTESKYIFLLVRVLFASWFLIDGIKRLKQSKED
ncbi:hypothetical protein H0I31_01595 [Tenacibaculum sp. AHE15PA]|uniref:hypothetical protein n=1 Tax=Tenacibaculum TaxID=104267 RepID=UPI001C4EE63F|nr:MULTISPECIES: hypothetical protein [Tenacibaculum]QXP76338.1 hypothetical protein H0I31_01595 [Tenacibaculum sp. AHE15PA]